MVSNQYAIELVTYLLVLVVYFYELIVYMLLERNAFDSIVFFSPCRTYVPFIQTKLLTLPLALADPVERTVREYSDRSLTSYYYG